MKKLLEIGDMKLPWKEISVEPGVYGDNQQAYIFTLPEDGSEYEVHFSNYTLSLDGLVDMPFRAATPFDKEVWDNAITGLVRSGKLHPESWTISFSFENEATKDYEAFDRGEITSIFGMRNFEDPKSALQVMATVQDVVVHWLDQLVWDDVVWISFSADSKDKGRVKLYHRFAKMLSKQLDMPMCIEVVHGAYVYYVMDGDLVSLGSKDLD